MGKQGAALCSTVPARLDGWGLAGTVALRPGTTSTQKVTVLSLQSPVRYYASCAALTCEAGLTIALFHDKPELILDFYST